MDDLNFSSDENSIEKEDAINSVVAVSFNLFEICIQALIVVVFVFNFFFRILTIQGDSMQNTLKDKNQIFVLSSFFSKPKEEDIIIVNTVDILEMSIIKRIVAKEGQTVDFRKEGKYYYLYVNGVKKTENYIKEPMEAVGSLKYPITIPAGYFFVMGDNRNNSTDSRNIGLVNLEKIVGVCRAVVLPLRDFRIF